MPNRQKSKVERTACKRFAKEDGDRRAIGYSLEAAESVRKESAMSPKEGKGDQNPCGGLVVSGERVLNGEQGGGAIRGPRSGQEGQKEEGHPLIAPPTHKNSSTGAETWSGECQDGQRRAQRERSSAWGLAI